MFQLFWRALAALALLTSPLSAQTSAPTRTRHVILVMSDGFRWQELFAGADERLVTKDQGVKNEDAVRAAFLRESAPARREALMPFVWQWVATHGQIYGNRAKGSLCSVRNPHRVSYPGYSEVFCGFPSESVDGNKKIWNPDVTVFEWLNAKPAFRGRVAAFGAWDLFPYIFNTERCGFPVDGGAGPLTFGTSTDRIREWNVVRAEVPYRWGTVPFDAMTFRPALEWLRTNSPRVMFLGLGETDEWAHEREYEQYLNAAHRVDAYLRELWETVQAIPEYRDSTSIIVTCDHGRGGDNQPGGDLLKWTDHNNETVGADETWIMVWGPDTPPLGERSDIEPVYNSQIAATIAALLGVDYGTAQPKAGPPLADALPRRPLRSAR